MSKLTQELRAEIKAIKARITTLRAEAGAEVQRLRSMEQTLRMQTGEKPPDFKRGRGELLATAGKLLDRFGKLKTAELAARLRTGGYPYEGSETALINLVGTTLRQYPSGFTFDYATKTWTRFSHPSKQRSSSK